MTAPSFAQKAGDVGEETAGAEYSIDTDYSIDTVRLHLTVWQQQL